MLAHWGLPVRIRIDVMRDDEADVFVGTSRDVKGLVVEAQTLDELLQEARELIPLLMPEPVVLPRSTMADIYVRQPLALA